MKSIMLAALIMLSVSIFITLFIYRDYTDRIHVETNAKALQHDNDTCKRQLRQCSYIANTLSSEMNKIRVVIDKNGLCNEEL